MYVDVPESDEYGFPHVPCVQGLAGDSFFIPVPDSTLVLIGRRPHPIDQSSPTLPVNSALDQLFGSLVPVGTYILASNCENESSAELPTSITAQTALDHLRFSPEWEQSFIETHGLDHTEEFVVHTATAPSSYAKSSFSPPDDIQPRINLLHNQVQTLLQAVSTATNPFIVDKIVSMIDKISYRIELLYATKNIV